MWYLYLLLGVLNIVILLCQLASPLINGLIITSLYNGNFQLTFLRLFISIIINFAATILIFTKTKLIVSVHNLLENKLRNDTFYHILTMPMNKLDLQNIGNKIVILNKDIAILCTFLTGKMLSAFFNFIYAIALLLIIFWINIYIGIIVLFFSVLSYIIFRLYSAKIKKIFQNQKKSEDTYTSFITQIFNAMKEIKLLGINDSIYMLHKEKNKCTLLSKKNLSITTIKSQSLLSAVSQIQSLVIMGSGIILVSKKLLSIDIYIALLSYSQKFTANVTGLSSLNSEYQQFKVAIDRYVNIFEESEYPIGGLENGIVHGKIEIKNLSFSYHSNFSGAVFKAVNILIRPNQINTIIGKSGCGKTTLLHIICGLYKADHGTIQIDGIEIEMFNKYYLNSCISIVTQNPVLFNMSIYENIKIVRPTATDTEIWDCCKKALIHDEIMKLPNQYNTLIAENSSNLSGGQKQRISIARALLKKAPILIFDEITSSLDNINQKGILEIITKLTSSSTIIMADHRYHHITNDSYIIYIESAFKINQGTHLALLESCPSYQKLIYQNI